MNVRGVSGFHITFVQNTHLCREDLTSYAGRNVKKCK